MGPYPKALQHPPGPLDFPHNFNPHAVGIWFQSVRNLPADPRSAWVAALRLYKAGCKSAGLSPFAESKQDTNIAIRNYLWHQRRHLVRFMNVTRFMVGIKPIRNLVREARLETYGFSIVIKAPVEIPDPTWVQTLFRLGAGYRFNHQRDQLRRYVLELDPGLIVFVYNQGTVQARRWFIGYEVKVPLLPLYPADSNMDLRAKEQFILDQLWRPLQNSYRALNQDRGRHL